MNGLSLEASAVTSVSVLSLPLHSSVSRSCFAFKLAHQTTVSAVSASKSLLSTDYRHCFNRLCFYPARIRKYLLRGKWEVQVMNLSRNHAWLRVEEHKSAGFGYRVISSTANHAVHKPIPGTKCIEVGTGLLWSIVQHEGEFYASPKEEQRQWAD